MLLTLLAVGKIKSAPEADLCGRYAERAANLGRAIGFSGIEIVEIAESKAPRAALRKQQEAERLRAAIPGHGQIIVFDEGGTTISSRQWADRLRGWQESGTRSCYLVIGGADGLDRDFRKNAALSLSLGRMTWPHRLARVMVCEQIYRAITIIANHPYHRE